MAGSLFRRDPGGHRLDGPAGVLLSWIPLNAARGDPSERWKGTGERHHVDT